MKKLFALLLAALMLFSLAACGGEEETTAPAETTTEAPTTAEPVKDGEEVATANGYAKITPAGDWEYKGEYSEGMLQFDNKAVAGASVYISEDQGFEAQKKSLEYAYTSASFEEITIGDNTYTYMQAKEDLAYLIAPVEAEGDYCVYIQIRGGSLEDARALLENVKM